MSADIVQDLVVVTICRCLAVSVKTVLSSNMVGKHAKGARDSSGFPILSQSDRDADVDTAVCGGGGEREEDERGRKEEGKNNGGERDESNISNEDYNQTYCLTG